MKRYTLILMMMLVSIFGQAQTDGVDPLREENDDVIWGVDMRHWNLDIRLGFSIGGTLPIGFPEGIRHINSYSPKMNGRIGFDIEHRYNDHWGLSGGLYYERKGFAGDATLKQFDVMVSVGGESINGPYTGNVKVNVIQTGYTLPVKANWWITRNVKLKFGPYISLIADRQFFGYAYGKPDAEGNPTAYLRRGSSSNAPLVYIGNDESTRGYFEGSEFNNYMRRFQYGLELGADCFFTRHLGVFLDMNFGLNSAFNSKEGNPVTMGLHPFYGTFGFVYKIGR